MPFSTTPACNANDGGICLKLINGRGQLVYKRGSTAWKPVVNRPLWSWNLLLFNSIKQITGALKKQFDLGILENQNMLSEFFSGVLKLICSAAIVTSCWLFWWLISFCIDKVLKAFVQYCENYIRVKSREGRQQSAVNRIYDPGKVVVGVAV